MKLSKRQKSREEKTNEPKQLELTTNSGLVERILKWVEQWERVTGTNIKHTKESRIKFLEDCLRYLGNSIIENEFKKEANSTYPNAYNFLCKTLPKLLKEDQMNKIIK